jgi:lysophospholipase L1-like esterase
MSAGQDAIPPIPAGSRYVAIGSSFAAGPGIAVRASASQRRAGRSAGNYAHLVVRALGLDLHDVTYSGATTSDILTPSAAGQPAQLEAVTPDTRLVTITAGGNDVGFLPGSPWPACPGLCGRCCASRPASPGSGIPTRPMSASRSSKATWR